MRKFFLMAMVVFSAFGAAFAQSNTGNLTITVSDTSGVIPGATVTVTDTQTGKQRTFVSNDDGSISVPQLDAGNYSVKVAASNRKTKVFNDVKVDVGQTYTLNAIIEAGNISETVEVTAGSDLINSSNGEISRTVDSRQIQELPLNGRNPLALIQLQAGTSSNGATNTVINGQRSSFTNITRDGLNIQDNFIRANATDFVPDRPNTDDVGEFTITNQNAGVEAGYGASQVQLVTPRGANKFSGSAYIYNRNSEFTANSFFNNFNNIKKPFLNRNQFGGKLSGPIFKNKLFFYGAYEGFRLRQSTTTTRTVLTSSARAGIFTYRDNAGVVRTLNLFTAQQIGPGTVSSIDSAVNSRILANLPTGNNTTVGDGLNTTGYTFTRKQNQDREAVTTRFDYELNDKNIINTTYLWRKENLLRPDVDNGGYSDTPFGFQTARTYTTNTAWRYTPSAKLTNEVRVALQLSRPKFDRDNQPSNFFFTVPLIGSPESTFQTQGRNTAIWTFADNAVYSVGNHSIRFGGGVNWFRINPFGPPAFAQSTIPTANIASIVGGVQLNSATGNTNFIGGINNTQLGVGNGLLALLGGLVTSANQTFNALDQTNGYQPNALPSRKLHYEYYSAYVGDSWRARPNLSVNFGLRWEYFTPLSELNGLALEPIIGTGQDITAAILNPNGTYNFVGSNQGDNRFFRPDKNNFAPNVSVAWSPNFDSGFLKRMFPGNGQTVLRGGFSLNYVNDEFVRSADNALSNNQGLTNQVSLTGLNQRLSTFSNPITAPAFSVPRTFAQNNALAGNFGTVFAIDPNIETPMLMQYNIAFERSLPWKMALELRYVGNRSTNLVRGVDFNQVNITTNGFLADFKRARANMAASGGATGDPLCTTAGCVPLTVFPTLPFGGAIGLANGAVGQTLRATIWSGSVADLATIYITNPGTFGTAASQTFSNFFLANPRTGVVDLVGNYAESNYNAFQAEVRKRFSNGFLFQANYSFQKTLTDAAGTGQTRFDPFIDNANQRNEYARADFDQQHVFNFNGIYELPFGKGRRFLNQGGILDQIFGGWQLSSIVRIASGAPISITDQSGTLNRGGRSGRQTAFTSLDTAGVRQILGIFNTPCGIFFVNPAAINLNQTALNSGDCANIRTGSFTGRGSEGFDRNGTPFAGQTFFDVGPGQTGNMARNAWNGPMFLNADVSLQKKFKFTERFSFQVRAEAFNVLNRANFFVGVFPGNGNIASTSFGRVASTFDPRIFQFVGRFDF